MSASTGSTSDWESAGFEDMQAHHQQKPENEVIVVELPDDLLKKPPQQERSCSEQVSTTSSALLLGKISKLNLKSGASSSSTTSQVSSSAISSSSFVKIKNKSFTAYRSTRDDETSSSSWSCVSSSDLHSVMKSGTSTNSVTSAAPSVASSVITNFETISLSGRIYRRCKRCSYSNSEDANICTQCDLALIANPCLEIDAQIARNLQEKEERDALQALQRQERKRKNLPNEPIFEQARHLVDEIQTVVTQLGLPLTVLGQGNLTILAAAFIDWFRLPATNRTGTDVKRVSLAYTFTRDDASTLDNVRRYGFEFDTLVSKNIETALHLFNEPGMVRRGGSLFSIPEHYHPGQPQTYHGVGWITAVVRPSNDVQGPPDYFGDGHISSDYFKIKDSSHILPLASFPASVWGDDFIQNRAFPRLEQLCEDFFHTRWECDSDTTTQFPSSSTTAPTSATDWLEESTSKKAKITPQNVDDSSSDEFARAIMVSREYVNDPFVDLVAQQAASFVDEDAALARAIAESEIDPCSNSVYQQKPETPAPEPVGPSSDSTTSPTFCFPDEESDDSQSMDTFLDLWSEQQKASMLATDKKSDDCIASGDSPSSIEFTPYATIGMRVQILKGSFEGHNGKVVAGDDTHVHVQVETVRSHRPILMMIRDRVRPVVAEQELGK